MTATKTRLRPHHAAWVSALLLLATVALFVGGLFEETAFAVVFLICFMPFVWYLGVKTGLAASRADSSSPAAPPPTGDGTRES